MNKSIKISDEDYRKVKEIAKTKDRKFTQVLSYAVNYYHKITVGNRLNTKV